MNKWIIFILIFTVSSVFADGGISSRLNIRTTDGLISNWPYQLKVTTGTLTDNNDGTMTLQTGGGSGGGGGSSNPSGSSGNIQYNNGGSFGGASFFNIHASSSSTTADTVWTSNSVGPVLTDANNCTWRTTIATTGNLVTSLIACPTTPSPFVGTCKRGVPIGLTLAFICPG